MNTIDLNPLKTCTVVIAQLFRISTDNLLKFDSASFFLYFIAKFSKLLGISILKNFPPNYSAIRYIIIIIKHCVFIKPHS